MRTESQDSEGDDGGGERQKAARLESQSSEFPEGEGGGERRRKKNRQHKKRDKWAALKSINLRVMPK